MAINTVMLYLYDYKVTYISWFQIKGFPAAQNTKTATASL